MRDFARAFPSPARVAIEAPRNHAFIHDLLETEGLQVLVSHHRHTEAITSCKRKSDRHDAITLARLRKADLLTESYVLPLQIRLLREWCGEYIQLTILCIRTRNPNTISMEAGSPVCVIAAKPYGNSLLKMV